MSGPIAASIRLPQRVPQLRRVVRFRRNVERLTPQQLADFRRAWARSYELPDDRGFGHFAGLHGAPPPVECPHHTEFFLPWHRAYLYFFEMALRDLVPNVTLPWFDWTLGDLPAAYTDESDDNPLTAGPIPAVVQSHGWPERTWREGPSGLPTRAEVDDALARDDFLDFSEAVANLHDQVHGSIGGAMGFVAVAAYDPVFWAHHCYVDRLWRIWQLRRPGAAPLPPAMLDQALAPFPMTVRQTLDVNALGYEYARSTLSIPFGGRP